MLDLPDPPLSPTTLSRRYSSASRRTSPRRWCAPPSSSSPAPPSAAATASSTVLPPCWAWSTPLFTSTAEFGAQVPGFLRCHAWDCRHGRVLFAEQGYFSLELVVWDPMTGCTRKLYGPGADDSFGVAVLCAVGGCDHRACHAGPFKLVYVGVYKNIEEGEAEALAGVSSPDTGDWSNPIPSLQYPWKEPCPRLDLAADHLFIRDRPSVVVDDALHFLLGHFLDDDPVGILKYSLSSDSLSQIDPPLVDSVVIRDPILMAMKDGSLGFAHVDGLTLHVWSRKILGSHGGAPWTHGRVVDLKNLLLPVKNPIPIGSVEDGDIIFVKTDLGVYEIDLN